MKKSTLLGVVATAIAASSCVTPDTSYTINGIVSDSLLNGQTVYLAINPTHGIIDSTVITNGEFQLSGKIDPAEIAAIETRQHRVEFVLEPGTIVIDLDAEVATGTPLNEVSLAMEHELDSINTACRNEMRAIMSSVTDRDSAMKAIMEIEENKRIPAINEILSRTFDQNRNNVVGALVLGYWGLEPAQFDSVLNLAGTVVKESPIVAQIIEKHNILKKTAEGQPFTDFTIEQPDGSKVSLSDYVGKGKYVLVDFWASWCGPCRREIPHIKEVYNQYHGDRFDVLGVAVWDKVEDTQKAIQELGTEWNQILNAQQVPTQLYGIEGIPHIILFAPDGTIVARGLREQALKDKVAEVMAQ